MAGREPEDLLPLTPSVFHILLALADAERHGYAIIKEVEASTEGRVRLGPGTLYGSVKRMLGEGLIEESDERARPGADDERGALLPSDGLRPARGRGRGEASGADGLGVARGKKLLSRA